MKTLNKHPIQIGGNTLQIVILLFILLKDGDEDVICEVTISKLAIFSVMEKNHLNEPFSHFAENQMLDMFKILSIPWIHTHTHI